MAGTGLRTAAILLILISLLGKTARAMDSAGYRVVPDPKARLIRRVPLREHVDHRHLPVGTRIYFDQQWRVTMSDRRVKMFDGIVHVSQSPLGIIVDDGRNRFVFPTDAKAQYIDNGTRIYHPHEPIPARLQQRAPDVIVIGLKDR
jgi:hypothetical protein